MFTGIVDHCGKVLNLQEFPGSIRLEISSYFNDLRLGESIAVDGCCLTVTAFKEAGSFVCDVSPETLSLTRASEWKTGAVLNLERAMKLSDRLGGHIVTGHIDQWATLAGKEMVQEYVRLEIEGVLPEFLRYLVKKGSIAVNGVSLTVNEVKEDVFSVMLVPHTLERTNLKELSVGSKVNLEFDWMAKLVVKRVEEIYETSVQH
jgi:riboflavin synthase